MKKRTSNFSVVIALTLIVVGFFTVVKKAEPLENKRFFDFPLLIVDWTGRDIPMSDYVYKGIETRYLFLRDYHSPRYQDPMNLSIVWFDDTNIAFHAPEACLGGVSNEVKENGRIRVRLDKEYEIGKIITNLGGIDYLVLYFFDVDGFITTNQAAIRWNVLKKRLMFKRSSASFVRIMTPLDDDKEDAVARSMDFLRDIQPLLPEYTFTNRVQK